MEFQAGVERPPLLPAPLGLLYPILTKDPETDRERCVHAFIRLLFGDAN
jgi:hypothetical protein